MNGMKSIRRGAGALAVAAAFAAAGGATGLAAQQAGTGTAAPRAAPAAAASPRVITYDEAIELALRQSVGVVQAAHAADLQSVTVTQQKLAFLPSLNLSTQAGQSSGRTFSQSEGGIVTNSTQSLNLGLNSSVTLFDGFRNVASLQSAQLGEKASELDLSRARQTAVMTVASDFLSLAEAGEQVRVRQEALAAQEQELRQIETFVKAGSRPIADRYQQQASVASAKAALVEAQHARALADLALVEVLQLDPSREYAFAAPPSDSADAGVTEASGDVAGLVERALANRPDLAATEAQQAAARQGVRAASASWWPTVSLSAGYSTGASSISTLSVADQLDQRRGGSISLGVSIPIFDRLQASTATEKARIQLDDAELAVQQQRQQVALDVRRAVLNRQTAEQQLEAAQAQLEAAQKALDATQQRYDAGVATLLEVTQARATQVSAASGLVNARWNLVLQGKIVEYYVGALRA